jgi:hypothetical protein
MRGSSLEEYHVGLFDKLFGGNRGGAAPDNAAPQHAVIVRFVYGSTDLSRLFAVEDRLEKAIDAAGAGEFDGNEVAADGSDGTLYMYGPDADALFAAVRPTLVATDFLRGATVTLRYGPPGAGAREANVVLDA